jgi:hypothetical protein
MQIIVAYFLILGRAVIKAIDRRILTAATRARSSKNIGLVYYMCSFFSIIFRLPPSFNFQNS